VGVRALTICICDVVGSTALGAASDDPDGLRRRYTAVLRAAVRVAGGEERKHLGDGLLATFPSATAGIAAAGALHHRVRALAERLGVEVVVRVGLAHGDVSEEDGDVFGDAVVVAARLCAAAEAGETLATEVVLAVAGRRSIAPVPEARLLALRGIDEPVSCVRLPAGHVAVPDLPSPLRQQLERDLVGRPDVVAALGSAVLDAVAGRGGAVVLEGEGGLGKTRLAAEAAAVMAALGGTVVYVGIELGLGDPHDAFATVVRALAGSDPAVRAALEQYGPALGAVLPERRPEGAVVPDRRATFDALASTLAAASSVPAVVVVDDLHHGGPDAVALFEHVAQRLREASVLLIGLTRPTSPAAGTNATVLRLAPLTDADVAELAGRRGVAAGLAPAVRQLTAGHPLLVDETLRALATGDASVSTHGREPALDGVPPSIEALVGRELEAHGGAVSEVALALAVAGPDAAGGLLQAVVAAEAQAVTDALAALARADLVLDRALGEPRYRHELFRRAVLDLAGPDAVRRVHRAVAAELDRRRAPARAAVWHELAASERDDVEAVGRRVLAVVADERRRLAMPTAERLAGALLERLTELHADLPATRAAAHVELAQVASWAADARTSQRHAMAAAEEARRCGDADSLAEAAIQFTGWIDAGTDDPAAEVLFADAHATLDRIAPARRARLLAAEADYWSISRSQPARGRPFAEQSRDLADRCGDPHAVVDSLWALANAGLGDAVLAERLDIVRRLLAVSGQEPTAHVLAHRLGVHAHLEAGDVAMRDRSAEVLRTLAEHDGEGSARLWADVADVEAALRSGRLDDAETAVGAFAAGGDDPTRRSIVVAQLFQLSRARGELAGLLPVLDAALAETPGLSAFAAARLLALHAAGRTDDALAGLVDLLRDGDGAVPTDQSRGAVLLGLAELAADLGATGPAEVLLDALADRAGTVAVAAQGVFSMGAYDRGIGRLELLLGRRGAARPHLEAAVALEQAIGDDAHRARSAATLAACTSEGASRMIQLHEPPTTTGARP